MGSEVTLYQLSESFPFVARKFCEVYFLSFRKAGLRLEQESRGDGGCE